MIAMVVVGERMGYVQSWIFLIGKNFELILLESANIK